MPAHNHPSKFIFFLPGSRVLSGNEVSALPHEKQEAAKTAGVEGVWLEIPCPDDACVRESGRICLEAMGSDSKPNRGLWLDIFCPEDRCLWKSGVELP